MFMVSTDCHALWLRLWKPCHDPTRFNIEATLFYAYIWQGDDIPLVKQHNFTVTTHDEICSPGYEPSGKCPRAILTGLATLITKKVVTATFVAPAAATGAKPQLPPYPPGRPAVRRPPTGGAAMTAALTLDPDRVVTRRSIHRDRP